MTTAKLWGERVTLGWPLRAWRGMCSQIWTPATLVWIGRNSPRYSIGASGFRSYMSM